MLDLKGAFSAVLIRVLPNCHLHFLLTVQIHCHLHFPLDHLHLPQTYPDLHQNHLPCLLVHLHHPLKLQLILIYHMHLSPRPLNPHLLLLLLQLPINRGGGRGGHFQIFLVLIWYIYHTCPLTQKTLGCSCTQDANPTAVRK